MLAETLESLVALLVAVPLVALLVAMCWALDRIGGGQ